MNFESEYEDAGQDLIKLALRFINDPYKAPEQKALAREYLDKMGVDY